MTFYLGHIEDVQDDLVKDGKVFGISIGRRAPMHRVHADCLAEIAQAGLVPVIFIGSTNGVESALFDAARNPLTLAQQKEQLKLAVPDIYDETCVLSLDDCADSNEWYERFLKLLDDAGFGGKSVLHFRTKSADVKQMESDIKPLRHYMDGFESRGIDPWQSFNRNAADDEISASYIRTLDLDNLSAEDRHLLAAPDYVTGLARQARADNPDKALLEQHGIPLTIFDLSLDRYRREACISTRDILDAALEKNIAGMAQSGQMLHGLKYCAEPQVTVAKPARKIVP